MANLVRISDVEHLGGRLLRVGFSDGVVRELDFAGALPGFLATVGQARLVREYRLESAT